MKRFFCVLVTAVIFSPLTVNSAVLGDFNQDGRIDLAESIYSLQVAAGAYPDIEPSCLLAGKGDWTDLEGSEYVECDVVKHGDSFYVCLQNHTPVLEVNEPPNQDFWAVLTIDSRAEIDELTNTVNILKERLGNLDYDGDMYTPNEGDCDDTNGALSPAAPEILDDGIDNNCDGLIDVLCADGATQSCGSDTGACVAGTRTCESGSWSSCTGEIGPTDEICNGIDDDCDAIVDEDIASCDDGNGCTQDDTCVAGSCQGVAVTCNDPLACTNDICNSTGATTYICTYIPWSNFCVIDGACYSDGSSNPTNACQTCDVQTSQEAWSNSTGACDDGLFCNGTEVCIAGVCTNSTGDPCSGVDGDDDCSESCDESSDNCTANDPDGSVCDDSNPVTSNDICQGGSCEGQQPTCDDVTQNGDETDIDCGGSCPPCEAGSSCLIDTDCSSSECIANICQE